VAALISLLQFVLGLVLAGTATPGTAHLLYEVVNRLDGVNMLALAILTLAGAASGALPRWLRYTGITLAAVITASGLAYLLLLASLAFLAIPAGVLLLVFITGTGLRSALRMAGRAGPPRPPTPQWLPATHDDRRVRRQPSSQSPHGNRSGWGAPTASRCPGMWVTPISACR